MHTEYEQLWPACRPSKYKARLEMGAMLDMPKEVPGRGEVQHLEEEDKLVEADLMALEEEGLQRHTAMYDASH